MELKENELRIGNLINDSITGLTNEVDLDFFHDLASGGFDLELFEPIRLSEIWFKKLGFKQNILFVKNDFEIGLDIDDFIKDQFTLRYQKCLLFKIKYVHQLQNLYFTLTGEELELSPK